jgi:chaperonin GroES
MELTDKKVLPTKLLIKKTERQQKTTPSGLIIPDTAEEITSLGTVVVAGKGTDSVPMEVKVGDNVMFPPRAIMRVKIDDDDYYLLNIQDVLLYWS